MAAKLLKNRPASEVDASHPHARTVVIGAVLVLILGIVAGLWLIRPSGDPAPADDMMSDVDLATWSEGVSAVCEQVATDHPAFAAGTEAWLDGDVAAVDAGVRDLTSQVRALALPTATEDVARAGETIQIGNEADRAWAAVSGGSASADEIAGAAALAEAYIASLIDLGADCSMFD